MATDQERQSARSGFTLNLRGGWLVVGVLLVAIAVAVVLILIYTGGSGGGGY